MSTSLSVNAGDYEELKQAYITWLQTQPQFADYDLTRPGDNMSVLIGLLGYNTYLNLFYHNMAVNETFLDTAQQRDSAVSRAKELNYTPRSFKSATTVVDLTVTSTNLARSSIIMPKGTLFTSRIGDRAYSFTTSQSYVSTTSQIVGSTIVFTFNDIELHEGYYLTETFPYLEDATYILPNEQVDTSSVNVIVLEDNGGAVLPYTRATTLFDLDAESKVYFIQGAPQSKYEVVFGDGNFGRKPKANSLIALDYRISSGELPNGARVFKAGQAIDGETTISVTTVTPAHSGAVFESIESIRLNAPRHFESQGNAVTPRDYISLLKENFPEIIDVAAYGGEDANPPQYGRVLISIVLNGIDYVPQSKEREFFNFLRERSATRPVLVEPTFVYAEVNTEVNYDIRKTSINADDIKLLVLSAVMNYNTANLNKFDSVLRTSRLTTAIDNAHPSIISNETEITLVRELTSTDFAKGAFAIDFGTPLESATSTPFLFEENEVILESLENKIILRNTTNDLVVRPVGTIDYETGEVTLSTFAPDVTANVVKLRAVPDAKDIASNQHTTIKIRESDVKITVTKG